MNYFTLIASLSCLFAALVCAATGHDLLFALEMTLFCINIAYIFSEES